MKKRESFWSICVPINAVTQADAVQSNSVEMINEVAEEEGKVLEHCVYRFCYYADPLHNTAWMTARAFSVIFSLAKCRGIGQKPAAAAASISSSTDLEEKKYEVGEEEGKILEHLCTNKCCYAG